MLEFYARLNLSAAIAFDEFEARFQKAGSRENRSPSSICKEQNEAHNMGLLVFEQRRANA